MYIVWKKLHLKRKSTYMHFFFLQIYLAWRTFINMNLIGICMHTSTLFDEVAWPQYFQVTIASFVLYFPTQWYFKMFFFSTKDLTENDEHCRRFLERCMPESFQKVCCCFILSRFVNFINERWRVLNTFSL